MTRLNYPSSIFSSEYISLLNSISSLTYFLKVSSLNPISIEYAVLLYSTSRKTSILTLSPYLAEELLILLTEIMFSKVSDGQNIGKLVQ